MSDSAATTLQQWAKAGKLGDVEFGSDGSTLKLNDETIPATESVSFSVGDVTCSYTLGSLFLQIKNPSQSLVEYRKTCKEYNVKDPVKTTEKNAVIGYFGASGSSSEAAPAAAASETIEAAAEAAAAPAEPSTTEAKEKHHHEKKDKHHRDKERGREKHSSSTSKKRSRSHSAAPAPSSSSRKEKAPKTIDPEKLFSNLSVVVGKREIKAQRDAEQATIHAALSTDGFQVSTEVLEKYKKENQDLMAHEIPVGDSSSILKAGAGKDLSRVLKLYTEAMSAAATTTSSSSSKPSGSSKHKSPTSTSGPNASTMKRQYLIGQKPIIVLPKAMTAPITMVNGYEFFANSKFIPRDKMQQQLRETKQTPGTTFTRTVNARQGGGQVEYEIMDNPKSKLHSSKDWERVVAVVVLGQAWQMKDWPGPYGNPVELFGRTYGFYIGMEGDKIPKDLQGWSVKQSRLNRDKRGLDSVTYASFWNGLDEWMTIHRPELLPQKDE
jgi:parafibromin